MIMMGVLMLGKVKFSMGGRRMIGDSVGTG